MFSGSSKTSLPRDIVVVQGRDAVLGYSSQLEELAHRCGQSGAMHWLGYFLKSRDARVKRPYLVLFLRPGAHAGNTGANDLRAAVLFVEYAFFGIRTRALTSEDTDGFRTVIAPVRERNAVSVRAAEVLLRLGAHVVSSSHSGAQPQAADPEPRSPRGVLDWARRDRTFRTDLRLLGSLDETLATLGKRTRTHLRYYRKRLEAATGCVFVADAARHLTEAQVLALNNQSLNPVPTEECLLRFRSGRDLEGGYVIGLRGADGRWLSLVGGWRQGKTSVLHWQMNAAGHERQSISSAMRLFHLEHEVERGSAVLKMYGGTPHSISHALVPEQVWDLVLVRRSLRTRMLLALARLFDSPNGFTGRTNFLAETLRSTDLEWRRAEPAVRAPAGGGPEQSTRPIRPAARRTLEPLPRQR